MSHQIKCPHCHQTNFSVAEPGKKELSAGKALIGYALAGAGGAVVGGVIGKKGKTTFVCNECGYVWKEKL